MDSQYEKVLLELAAIHGGPCVSIYMPTAHGKNGCDENILRFKNLKKRVIQSLEKGYDNVIVANFVRRLDAIERDTIFWNHQFGGGAIFLSLDFQRILKLHRGVQELAIVADRFHTKPLVRIYQTLDQFAVVSVSMNHARMFRGDQDTLEPDAVGELGFSFSDFFGIPDRDRHFVAMSVAGNASAGAKSRAVVHNYDDLDAKKKIDLAKYFAGIDEIICRFLHDAPNTPVVLAALPEYQSAYRAHTRIPRLLENGILANPDAMSLDEIRKQAWSLVSPYYEKLAEQVSTEFRNAQLAGKGSDQLQEIARALSRGRVGKLLIEQDREIPGRLMLDTGIVLFADINNPHVNDLLDDFADIVNHSSGKVVVLPASKMPTEKGVAAIYRY